MRRRRRTTKKKKKESPFGGGEIVTINIENMNMIQSSVDCSSKEEDTTNFHQIQIDPPSSSSSCSNVPPPPPPRPPPMDLSSVGPSHSKAVGARKRKPTQISKIVDKRPSSCNENKSEIKMEQEDTSTDEEKSNNNTNRMGIIKKKKNGMIQNIVTELKSAKRASSSQMKGGSEDEDVEDEEEDTSSSNHRTPPEKVLQYFDHHPHHHHQLQSLQRIRKSSSAGPPPPSSSEDHYNGEESQGSLGLPFHCGVCQFVTPDGGILLKHMRTHSGDKAFQCRLCCFTFTTKANCERHLRNRHGQIDREQIRSLVIVFSPASPTNSESESEPTTDANPIQIPPLSQHQLQQYTSPGVHMTDEKERLLIPNVTDLRTGRYNSNSFDTDDEPLDLSVDAVDLSIKNRMSLLRPKPIYPSAEVPNLLLTSPFVTKREPIVHPHLALPMIGNEDRKSGIFNGCGPFPTTSLIRPSSDLMKRPNTNNTIPSTFPIFGFGGPSSSYTSYPFQSPVLDKISPSLSIPQPSKPSSSIGFTPVPRGIDSQSASFGNENRDTISLEKEIRNKIGKKDPKAESSCSVSSASPTTTSRKRSDPKNGDYQKPKQRRYRTERPYSCPHCPAKFTLRSNMERHGKHQHPSVWQRSPSNRVINRQQKQTNQQGPLGGSLSMVHSGKYVNSSSELKSNSKIRNLSNGDSPSNVDVRAVIAQQLKRKLSNTNLMNGDNDSEMVDDGDSPGDLASVSQLLDRVKNSNIAQYFSEQGRTNKSITNSEDDLSGTESLVSSGGEEEEEEEEEEDDDEEEEEEDEGEEVNDPEKGKEKKKSAYSSAPHKISCPHCTRRFPWTSSLRRHLLTHTGQKPYQCSQCPLLFTTKSNCDRHLARKHHNKRRKGHHLKKQNKLNKTSTTIIIRQNDQSTEDEEGIVEDPIGRGGKENETEVIDPITPTPPTPTKINQSTKLNSNLSTNSSPAEDVSFRCHLCEAAATERDVLLAHMEEDHKETYHLLVSKGALTSSPPSENSETEPPTVNTTTTTTTTPHDTTAKEGTHRKVMCVFCVRRFWSVEDLRRHIRSHSGERPFSCTHCSRRFTLKHSMLRHLKKHNNSMNQTPKTSNTKRSTVNNLHGMPPPMKSKGGQPENEDEEGNLISRLLGIQDDGLVDQLLTTSDPKDAAKLLGLRLGLSRQNSASISTST